MVEKPQRDGWHLTKGMPIEWGVASRTDFNGEPWRRVAVLVVERVSDPLLAPTARGIRRRRL